MCVCVYIVYLFHVYVVLLTVSTRIFFYFSHFFTLLVLGGFGSSVFCFVFAFGAKTTTNKMRCTKFACLPDFVWIFHCFVCIVLVLLLFALASLSFCFFKFLFSFGSLVF